MKKIFLLLFNILLLCSSIFAQASRFAFKCKLDEDSLVFIKTGNIYVQFKDNINSAERTRITNFFIDKGIQSEYVSDMIVRLKTSVNPNSVGSLSNILSDDFILCSSEELIYPVDSTIQWAVNDIFVQL